LEEAVSAVANALGLSEQERTQVYATNASKAIFPHKVAWAKTYLKQSGLIQNTRTSHFRITERGLAVLAEPPTRITIKYLEQFPEYVDFKNRRKDKGVRETKRAVAEFGRSAETYEVTNTLKSPTTFAPQSLSFTDAAEQVLQRFGHNQPMHYRDITTRALQLGFVATRGQTPEQTMYAQIGTEIERQQRLGEVPRFTKYGKGMVGLSHDADVGLAGLIDKHNTKSRKVLRERLYSMDPTEFEALVGQLLAKIGFERVEVTSRSRDGGIDVRGTLVVAGVIRTNMAVQVKRWTNNVQSHIVQQVHGSLGTHDKGLIITTSDFSIGARQEADRPNAVPVALMNGDELVGLLVENDLGVHKTALQLIELGEIVD
jgi:restriction system protein